MAQRQPEGILKDTCRDEHAKPNDLLFWQIEGKKRNGVPDTLAGRVAGRCMLIEFKRPGEQPNEQQWLRIYELREAGQEAWWCDSVAGYRRLVGLDLGGYDVVYPPHIEKLIALGTSADDAKGHSRAKHRRA